MTNAVYAQSLAASVVAALLCLTGCQQLSNWHWKSDKITEARKDAAARDSQSSPTINREQKIDVQMAVAKSFESDGQTEEAIGIYQDVLKKDKGRVDACHRLALLYSKKGDWESAKKYFEIALKKAPKSADLLCDLGYNYYLQRKFKEAEPCWQQAIKFQPQHARAHNNLGLLLARTGREADAMKEFAKAGCSDAESRANLGLAYTIENRWQDARIQYRLALTANPDLATARNGLQTLQTLDPKLTPASVTETRNQGADHLAIRGGSALR